MRLLLALLLSLLAGPLHAETFRATVSHVTDGDTLWVKRGGGGDAIEIRLLDLDAPEGCQAYGAEAKHALRERVLRKPVRVHTKGVDDYGRQLARIEHRREDINAWMVRYGYAWSGTYRGRAGPYAKQEELARSERRGLWSLPGALEPRAFRKRFGRCQ